MRAHGHRGYRNEQLEDAQEETVTQCKTLKARREADSFHRSGAHRCVERYLAFETSASAFETKVLALRRLGLKRRLGDEGSSGTPSATSTRRLHRSIESGEYAADAAEHVYGRCVALHRSYSPDAHKEYSRRSAQPRRVRDSP